MVSNRENTKTTKTSIGYIPSEWEIAKIGDIFDVKQGKSLSSKKKTGNLFKPFLRTSNVFWGRIDLSNIDKMYFKEEECNVLSLQNRDLLVCEGGAIGRTAIWKNEKSDCYYQNHLHRLRLKNNNICPYFIMYWMQVAITQLNVYEGFANKTTIPNLSQSRLCNFDVPLPKINEQQKIAAILFKIQQAIELQESIIETAQELKKSTMQHVFTYGLRGENTKETEIGMVPESWKVKQIGNFCKVQGGYAFKSSDYQKNGIKLFKISNVSFGKTVWVETSFLSTSYIEKYSEYLLMPGDLLMAMTRPIVSGGIKITRLRNEDCPCLLNQRVARFNISLSINKEYLFQVLFNPYFINAIGLGALGSQQPNISATQIEQIRIPFTGLDEQKEIADILKSVDKKIELHASKKIALQNMFKTMLNKLMTGEILVKDLDIDMADVKH